MSGTSQIPNGFLFLFSTVFLFIFLKLFFLPFSASKEDYLLPCGQSLFSFEALVYGTFSSSHVLDTRGEQESESNYEICL